MAAACGNERNETDLANSLDRQVCTGADLGDGFNHQTSGDFSPANLAALGDDEQAQRKQFEAAGMIRGHFAYWKQVAGHPPFEPPLDIVCQVIEFESDDDATTFVATQGNAAAPAVIALLPPTRQQAEVTAPGAPAGSRAFAITADSDAGRLTLGAVIAAAGRYVRSVYTGGLDGSRSLEESVRIQERMAARLN